MRDEKLFEEFVCASRLSAEHLRGRCADIETTIHRLLKVQAVAAATTRCMVCNPLVPGEPPAHAPGRGELARPGGEQRRPYVERPGWTY